MANMIILSDEEPFAEGYERWCYVHPGDSNKCLKIVKPQYVEGKRRKRIYRRLRSPSYYDPNIADYKAHQYLKSLNDVSVYEHIPRCYGFVETDRGTALSVQLMRCAGGGIAPTLEKRVLQGTDDILKKAVQEFTIFMNRNNFSEYGDVSRNIMSVRLSNGKERIYMTEYKHIKILHFFRRWRIKRDIDLLQKWFKQYG